MATGDAAQIGLKTLDPSLGSRFVDGTIHEVMARLRRIELRADLFSSTAGVSATTS